MCQCCAFPSASGLESNDLVSFLQDEADMNAGLESADDADADAATNNAANANTAADGNGALSKAEIGGIAAGALVGCALVAALVVVLVLRRRGADASSVDGNPLYAQPASTASEATSTIAMQPMSTLSSMPPSLASEGGGAHACTVCGKTYPLAADVATHMTLRHSNANLY